MLVAESLFPYRRCFRMTKGTKLGKKQEDLCSVLADAAASWGEGVKDTRVF